jgi:predicted  nucleic acid-binding Zn ribbon protein
MITVGKIIAFKNNLSNDNSENFIPDNIRYKFFSLISYLENSGIIDRGFFYVEDNKLINVCHFFHSWTPEDKSCFKIDVILDDLIASGITINITNDTNNILCETSPDIKDEGSIIMYVTEQALPFNASLPPFWGGKTGLPIPVTEFTENGGFIYSDDAVLCWSRKYKAISDVVYLADCISLERDAIHQLSSPLSELSTEGIGIANELSELIAMPVYYYLWIDYKKKWHYRCPLCTKKLTTIESNPKTFIESFYVCDVCKLIMN